MRPPLPIRPVTVRTGADSTATVELLRAVVARGKESNR